MASPEGFAAGRLRVLEQIAGGAPLRDTLASLVQVVEDEVDGLLGRVLLWDDAAADLRPAAPRRPSGPAAAVSWTTPVRSGDGHLLGALEFAHPRGALDEAHLRVVGEAVHLAGIAIERERVTVALAHQALHDPLTALPNRALFLDRLDQALARAGREGRLAAVLLLDVDRFRLVNDTLGPDAGDALLHAIALRLREAVRAQDTVSRVGGDEFAVVVEGASSERDATEVAERIAAAFTRPFVAGGYELFLTASIGIAVSARVGSSADRLARDADAAMHRAKGRGRARYELADDRMRARAVDRLRTEGELRGALERRELVLAWQPIVALGSGRVHALEALVRWRHPRLGLVGPEDFVGLAEEAGIIGSIGAWVLRTAAAQAARWHRHRPDAPPVNVAVNLSARQLAEPGLPELVEGVLAGTDIDPATLALEITETVLIEDAAASLEVLRSLRELGVRLVLDDFGTGWSSLSYLKRFPIDALKIDRSLIAGLGSEPDDAAIVGAVLAMARALELDVVAEGVETERQLSELHGLGCELAQGFLFGRPVPAPAVLGLLRRRFEALVVG